MDKVKLEKIETFFALNKKNKKIFFTDSIVQKNIINFVDESRFFEKTATMSTTSKLEPTSFEVGMQSFRISKCQSWFNMSTTQVS